MPGDPTLPAPGATLYCGECRALPAALEQARGLHPIQCPIQRPVCGQPLRVLAIADSARDEVAAELGRPGLAELDAGIEPGDLDREQCAGRASHGMRYTQLYAVSRNDRELSYPEAALIG